MPRFVRTASFDFDIKPSTQNGDTKVMSGRLAVFNDWTEINSPVERPFHFMERIARGAFTKTIQEQGNRLKVLFQHGRDSSIGMKPLGRITRLEEVGDGVEYDVELLDADYVRSLIPGIEAGLYGASFTADDVNSLENFSPQRSSYNPNRLPEITRTEVRMYEFGPVTFPSYGNTSTKMRSQTEEFMLPGLQELVQLIRSSTALTATEEPQPEPDSPDGDTGDEGTPEDVVSRSSEPTTTEGKPSWFLE